ncbi:hypothetical protein Hanom_Chr10g00938921 [Helianthus anomalus]
MSLLYSCRIFFHLPNYTISYIHALSLRTRGQFVLLLALIPVLDRTHGSSLPNNCAYLSHNLRALGLMNSILINE